MHHCRCLHFWVLKSAIFFLLCFTFEYLPKCGYPIPDTLGLLTLSPFILQLFANHHRWTCQISWMLTQMAWLMSTSLHLPLPSSYQNLQLSWPVVLPSIPNKMSWSFLLSLVSKLLLMQLQTQRELRFLLFNSGIGQTEEAKVAKFAWEPDDFKLDSTISPGLRTCCRIAIYKYTCYNLIHILFCVAQILLNMWKAYTFEKCKLFYSCKFVYM